jgi:hypothetical protein
MDKDLLQEIIDDANGYLQSALCYLDAMKKDHAVIDYRYIGVFDIIGSRIRSAIHNIEKIMEVSDVSSN